MAKHTVYLDDKLDADVREAARQQGCSLTEVIRNRLDFQFQKKLERMEEKIDALFALVELMCGDIGYVSGATRAATKNIDSSLREGTLYETHLRRTASSLRRTFEASSLRRTFEASEKKDGL